MNKFIFWAEKALSQYHIKNINLVFNKKYTSLYTIDTNEGLFHLKVHHESFNYEQKLLNYLYSIYPNYIPKVFSINRELNCFITEASGMPVDQYLKDYLKDTVVVQTIDNFLSIQTKVDVNILKSLGVRDLSKNKLVDNFYYELKNSNYISNELIHNIVKFKPKLEELLNEFNNLKIIDSLEHGEFNFSNVLYKDEDVMFIDWEKAAITNPLFSFISFSNSLVKNLNIKSNTNMFHYLNDKYIEKFIQLHNISNIDKALELSTKLYPLYSSLSLMNSINLDNEKCTLKEKLILELNSLTCY